MPLANIFSQHQFDPAAYEATLTANKLRDAQTRALQQEMMMNKLNEAKKMEIYRDSINLAEGAQNKWMAESAIAEFGQQGQPQQPSAPVMQPPMTMQQPMPNSFPEGQPPFVGGPPPTQGMLQQAMPPQVPQGPPMQGPSPLPQMRTVQGLQQKQELEDRQRSRDAKRVTYLMTLLDFARQNRDAGLVEKLGKSIARVSPEWQEVGSVIAQAGVGRDKERVLSAAELTRLKPEQLAKYDIDEVRMKELQGNMNPADLLVFKLNDEGKYSLSDVKQYNMSRAGKGGTGIVGRGQKMPGGVIFDSGSRRYYVTDEDEEGNIVPREITSAEADARVQAASSDTAERTVFGKEVGKGAAESIIKLPELIDKRDRMKNLAKRVDGLDPKVFGQAQSFAQGVLALYPNVETNSDFFKEMFQNTKERNKLLGVISSVFSDDIKKMFGPPFSDADFRIMASFMGTDMKSKDTLLEAINLGIASTNSSIKAMEAARKVSTSAVRNRLQQAAPPPAPQQESGVKAPPFNREKAIFRMEKELGMTKEQAIAELRKRGLVQ